MEEKKTHFRKVFKSDHLGVADLEEYLENTSRLIFNISQVQQEYGVKVAGRKGDHNIAYFSENIKPLVLNATNSKVIKSFCKTSDFPKGSPFVEDWKNVLIEMYIDSSVKMKGEVVGGVRIRPQQPRAQKPVLNEQHPRWGEVKEKVKNGTEKSVIEKHFSISKVDWALLCS